MASLTKLITHIKLEMSGDTKRYLVSVKQGDRKTRYIVAKLLNNGEEYTIPSGAKAIVNIKKPDGKRIYNSCTYSGSEVTVELTSQALAASGTAYCDIEIRTQDDSEIITSVTFEMEIEESMRSDKAIQSSNEFTALEEKISEHIKNINDTEKAIKQAEEDRVRAENNRAEEENIRQQNEKIRIQQEEQRQKDTLQVIKNTEDAITKTVTATKECEEIIEQAKEALQNQEQLEITLNAAIQMKEEVSQMQSTVIEVKKQVETSEANAKASEESAKVSEENAKTSEEAAKVSEKNAKTSEEAAKVSEKNAKTSEEAAKVSEENAKISEGVAKEKALETTEQADRATEQALLSQSYAVGTSGVRDGESIDNSKYYSERAKEYMNAAQAVADLVVPQFYIDFATGCLMSQTKAQGMEFYLDNGNFMGRTVM